MHVTLLYFNGCPNWHSAEQRLRQALDQTGQTAVTVTRRQVTSHEEAEQLGFRGSPTLLVNGHDPFADPDAPVGLGCRVYLTDQGLQGAPTVEQIVKLLDA